MLLANLLITPAHGRSFLLDAHVPDHGPAKGTVIFAHGFKGFKDWGHWALIGDAFARAGYTFIRFNFSHNGTTVDQPHAFADLEAFGQNNYSLELADLEAVIDWVFQAGNGLPEPARKTSRLFLIGHSRGGPVVLVKAAEDPRVCGVITWAAVSDMGFAWRKEAQVEEWREKGVQYVQNSRTGQSMPLYFQLYEDYQRNRQRYNLQRVVQHLHCPYLIVHGSADTSVPVKSAQQLQGWKPTARLHIIPEADHVFNGREPYEEKELPAASRQLVAASLAFLNAQSG